MSASFSRLIEAARLAICSGVGSHRSLPFGFLLLDLAACDDFLAASLAASVRFVSSATYPFLPVPRHRGQSSQSPLSPATLPTPPHL